MPVRIVEGQLPYTAGTGIEIDSNKVISLLLREENNLIMVNDDNEVYTDLQLEDGILPTDDFPVGVTVGKVLQSDGWTQSGLLLNWKTTSGDYARWIYANDGNIYFDNGTGTWKQVYYSSQVDAAIAALRTEVYDYFIKYSDYYRVTKSGNQFNLDLSCEITPDQDFVVDAPLNIEEGQTYVLRVHSGATSYVMSLGAYVTNPKGTNIALSPNTTDTFVFLAVDDTRVELQPIADPSSSVNDGILTIQKNGTTVGTFTANQATNSTINVTVPNVIDNLTSTSTTNSLSANQGYLLKGMIDDLAGFGKFLSLRDATTGLPISFPLQTPYTYSTGDYFVVETVSTATPPVNYRPSGSSYTGTASSTTESDELEVGDVYVYDGSIWLLQSNHGKTVTFGNIAGDPYDNTNLGNVLNAKQDTLIAGSNITIAADGKTISANNTTYSSATSSTAGIVKLGSDTVQTEAAQTPSATTGKSYAVQLNSSGQMLVNVPRANTTYSSLSPASGGVDVSLVTTGEKYTWNNKQDALVSGTNIKTVNSTSLLGSGDVSINDIKVSSSAPASPTEGMAWYDTTNDQLKVYDGSNWNVTGKEYNAGPGIEIGTYNNYSTKQGPCSEGFHIPTKDEFQQLLTAYSTLTNNLFANGIRTYLKIPYNRVRRYDSGDPAGVNGGYWTCTHSADSNKAYNFYMPESGTASIQENGTTRGYGIRPFKNGVSVPNSSWTTLYAGTGDAGIFHNATEGVISISADGVNWMTIADKNCGATTVYNTGDTPSEDNCGKFYQWGNNYGFAWTGAITTSSSQTSASSYGPSEYSRAIFVTQSSTPSSWDSSDNNNLWGGEVGVVTNAITNTGVLSVNGQTGDVTVAGGIQNDTTGTTTTVTKIRAGSEAEYNSLGNYDQSTIYHIY